MTVSLDDLYLLHMNDIYRYLLKLTRDKGTAEDLTQETYARAFQFLSSYQGEKVRPWLFKVAYHTFIDWYRKNKRSLIKPLSDKLAAASHSFDQPAEELLRQEIWRQFAAITQSLPHKQEQALILYYFHQLSYEEIAKILNLALTDVKISIYRGRQKLRKLWKEDDDELQSE